VAVDNIIRALPLAAAAPPPLPEAGAQAEAAARFEAANAGHEPAVFFCLGAYARLEGVYAAARACLAATAPPEAKPGSSKGGKRREADPAEALLAAYPQAWDGAIATIAALVASIRALGTLGGGSGGGGGMGRAALGAVSAASSPAPGAGPRASMTGAADRGGASPLPGAAGAGPPLPRAPSAVPNGAAGAGGSGTSAAAAAPAAAAAASAAAAAAFAQAGAVLTKRLELAIEAASVPDSRPRLLQAAFQRQLLELAGALPGVIAEARQAAGGNSSSGGGAKHANKHASTAAPGTAPDVAAAAATAAAGAMGRALDASAAWLQRQGVAVSGLLEVRRAAAEAELARLLEGSGAEGGPEAQPGAAEELAWRAHAAERARARLRLD
jgi:hypothetical protein